jgi:hypothetical protein
MLTIVKHNTTTYPYKNLGQRGTTRGELAITYYARQ